MPSEEDVPGDDVGECFSFVTSTEDPKTGYFMPINKAYVYKVTCENSHNCVFTKILTNYINPNCPVAMAFQSDAGLNCN